MSFDMKKIEKIRGYLRFCEKRNKVRSPKTFYLCFKWDTLVTF